MNKDLEQQVERLGIDQSNDELVVKTAVPSAFLGWYHFGAFLIFWDGTKTEQGVLCSPQTTVEAAWKVAREHPLVQAFERQRVQQGTAVEMASALSHAVGYLSGMARGWNLAIDQDKVDEQSRFARHKKFEREMANAYDRVREGLLSIAGWRSRELGESHYKALGQAGVEVYGDIFCEGNKHRLEAGIAVVPDSAAQAQTEEE